MKYINTLTQNIIDTNCDISGKYWKKIEPKKEDKETDQNINENTSVIENENEQDADNEDTEKEVIIGPDPQEKPAAKNTTKKGTGRKGK